MNWDLVFHTFSNWELVDKKNPKFTTYWIWLIIVSISSCSMNFFHTRQLQREQKIIWISIFPHSYGGSRICSQALKTWVKLFSRELQSCFFTPLCLLLCVLMIIQMINYLLCVNNWRQLRPMADSATPLYGIVQYLSSFLDNASLMTKSFKSSFEWYKTVTNLFWSF